MVQIVDYLGLLPSSLGFPVERYDSNRHSLAKPNEDLGYSIDLCMICGFIRFSFVV